MAPADLPEGLQWYDRDGRPILPAEAERLLATPGYDKVRCTTVLDMADLDWVRDVVTVWIGVDLSAEHEVPMIFETVVFDRDHAPLVCRAYATEAEAASDHDALVTAARAEATDAVVLESAGSA